MGSFLSSRVRFEKMHAQKRVELKWMFLLTPGSCNCLTSTEHQQLLPSLAGQTAYHTTLSDSSPLRKRRRQGSMELGQGVVCFYICSFFFFFFSRQQYVTLPLHPSAMCGNPSVTVLVLVLLLLAQTMNWKRQNIYPGVSEPVGRFSLILAIELGVGRHAMVQLAPTLVGACGQGYMATEKLIWFSQRPSKPSVPYFVPSEQARRTLI